VPRQTVFRTRRLGRTAGTETWPHPTLEPSSAGGGPARLTRLGVRLVNGCVMAQPLAPPNCPCDCVLEWSANRCRRAKRSRDRRQRRGPRAAGHGHRFPASRVAARDTRRCPRRLVAHQPSAERVSVANICEAARHTPSPPRPHPPTLPIASAASSLRNCAHPSPRGAGGGPPRILPSLRAPARSVTATSRRVSRAVLGATAALIARRRPVAPPPIWAGGWPHRRLGLGAPPPLPSAGAAAEPRRGCGLRLGWWGFPRGATAVARRPAYRPLTDADRRRSDRSRSCLAWSPSIPAVFFFSRSCLDRRSSADALTPHHHPRQPPPSCRARSPPSGSPTAGVASLRWPSRSRPPPILSAPQWHPPRPPTLGPASPTACRT